MSEEEDNEPVRAVRNTGKRIVPCSKCSHKTECASSNNASLLWGLTVVLEVPNTEKQKSHIESEEEEEERNGRSKRAEEQDEGEDEPAHKEKTERVEESGFRLGDELRLNVYGCRN